MPSKPTPPERCPQTTCERRSPPSNTRPRRSARKYTVAFTPESLDQLTELYRCIVDPGSSPETAARCTDAINCERLGTFPHRRTRRDDIRPGLRVTHRRKRSVIAFVVEDDRVSILGVYYCGQNYEIALDDESAN